MLASLDLFAKDPQNVHYSKREDGAKRSYSTATICISICFVLGSVLYFLIAALPLSTGTSNIYASVTSGANVDHL